jgi:hypothetical protein
MPELQDLGGTDGLRDAQATSSPAHESLAAACARRLLPRPDQLQRLVGHLDQLQALGLERHPDKTFILNW